MIRVLRQIMLWQVDPILVNFDFAKIDVESYNSEQSSSNRQMDLKKIGSSNDNDYSRRKEMRYFWDGGLMTNTPLI